MKKLLTLGILIVAAALQISCTQPTAIVLDWAASPVTYDGGVVGFKVYRRNPDGSQITLAQTVAGHYVDAAVQRNVVYLYSVSSLFADGEESAQCAPMAGVLP